MMYNWNIDIWLKSGVKLECVYHGEEDTTTDVANKLFTGKPANEMVGINGRKHSHNVLILIGEVAAVDIYI